MPTRLSLVMRTYSFVIILCACVFVCRGRSCNFPDTLRKHGIHEHWKWKLTYDDANRNQKETLLVTFKAHQMEVKSAMKPGGSLHKIVFSRSCIERVMTNTYIVTHEAAGQTVKYLCMEFVFRSEFVLQLKTSEHRDQFDSSMCRHRSMRVNQWPLVSRGFHNEYKVCAFTGGFDLRMRDWTGKDNQCNEMAVPMRIESECLKGEGITFNFRAESCVTDVPMDMLQKTICVTDWTEGRHRYSVLRKQNNVNGELWCLKTPIKQGDSFKAKLFLDFTCGNRLNESVKFLTLPLKRTQQKAICSDEDPTCGQHCNKYMTQHCLKSCNKCTVSGAGACSFPQDMQGDWFQRNFDKYSLISVTTSEIKVHSVGTFTCLAPPATLDRDLRKFALLSTFDNGCLPKYTCIAVRNYKSPSVLAYSLAQSITWPYSGDQSAELSCKDEHFQVDPPPVKNTYRTALDTPKTTISQEYSLTGVQCGDIDAYTIQGEFYTNETCSGRLYRDCTDTSRLRFEYVGCMTQPRTSDYVCLATYHGRYWERVITIQNLRDQKDSRCLMFSTSKPDELLMMAASDCDKFSWEYVISGQRTAIGSLRFKQLAYKCKNIPPIVRSAPTSSPVTPAIVPASHKQADGPKKTYDTTLRPIQPILSYEIDTNAKYQRNPNDGSHKARSENTIYERKSVGSGGKSRACPGSRATLGTTFVLMVVALGALSNR